VNRTITLILAEEGLDVISMTVTVDPPIPFEQRMLTRLEKIATRMAIQAEQSGCHVKGGHQGFLIELQPEVKT
jgi:hypothetical protein